MTKTCSHRCRGCVEATLIGLMLAGAVACEESRSSARAPIALDTDTVVQWKLPKRLAEISGLAFSADDRLFAHNDEQGVIYQLDWQAGRIVKAFVLGETPIREDFEGIAIAGADFYLLTSGGILYRTREGADGEHVVYQRIDTGLGAQCEFEGLAYDGQRKLLLAACKNPRSAALKGQVAVFAWSLQRQAVDQAASFTVPVAALADRIDVRHFNPSSIEISRDGKQLWLLAGKQQALAEVDLRGQVVAVTRLSATLHPQPEGLTFGPGGELIIADEGTQGRAKLAIYRPR